jgi:hypothetical protein
MSLNESESESSIPELLSPVEIPPQIPLPPSPTVAMVTKKILVDGLEIEIHLTAQLPVKAAGYLYKKESRSTLTADKLNELFERATKTSQVKYDLMNLSITDTEKLNDTYNLQMTVEKTKANHIRFDMDNVFQVLKVDPNDNTSKSHRNSQPLQ